MCVLGMIILSSTFFYKISSPQILPFAYADNWSWIAKSIREQVKTPIKTLNWIESLRMQIAQSKSWAWGTDKNFKECARNLHLLFPQGDIVIQVRQTAKDLGMQIHYDKQQCLGCIQDRINICINRANRMEWIPMDINQKAWMIQTAIWPVALYSAESQAIGLKHFRDLRRAATNALIGRHKTSSAFLACRTLLLLYVVVQALRTIRRLVTYNKDMAEDIIKSVVAFQGDYSIGPASSLKIYLTRIGWELHDDGSLMGPDGLVTNIVHASSKELCRDLKLGWQRYICQNIANRIGAPPSINMHMNQKVYQSLKPAERSAIALNIVGGFQTGATKHMWDSEELGTCELCGQVDDRAHRLLTCPATAHIRAQHPHAIHILNEVCPNWVFLPLARMDPEISLLRNILQNRRIPDPVTLHPTFQDGLPHFKCFTDGACILPTGPSCRRATWALVQDVSMNGETRHEQASCIDKLHDDIHVPDLRCVAVSNTSGYQTPARSELQAVLYTIQCAIHTDASASVEIYTDAQYVCNITASLQNYCPTPHKLSNYDMISILKQLWNPHKFQINKIKAHRRICDAENEDDLWHLLANHMVDRAAASALNNELLDIKILANDIHKFNQEEFVRLRHVYRYLADFNVEHIRLRKETHLNNHEAVVGNQGGIPSENEQFDVYQTALESLTNWNPDNYRPFFIEDCDLDMAKMCGAGVNAAVQVWSWLKTLSWPDPNSDPHPNDKGISWFELMINYSICTQQRLPVQVAADGRFYTHAPYDSDIAAIQTNKFKTANYHAYSLEKLVRQMENLSMKKLIPKFPKYVYRPCTSLYSIGLTRKVAGLARRPIMRYQTETCQTVWNFVLANKTENHLYATYHIPVAEPIVEKSELQELSTKERFYGADQIRKRNKKLLRSMELELGGH